VLGGQSFRTLSLNRPIHERGKKKKTPKAPRASRIAFLPGDLSLAEGEGEEKGNEPFHSILGRDNRRFSCRSFRLRSARRLTGEKEKKKKKTPERGSVPFTFYRSSRAIASASSLTFRKEKEKSAERSSNYLPGEPCGGIGAAGLSIREGRGRERERRSV